VQYDHELDEAMSNILTNTEQMGYLELKRQTEKSLGRGVSKSVFQSHINKQVESKVLNKHDSGGRGRQVNYSMTEEAKKKRQLNLLGIAPTQVLFRKIYADLFFKEIIFSHSYDIDDLDGFLSSINASRRDLRTEYQGKINIPVINDGTEPYDKRLPYDRAYGFDSITEWSEKVMIDMKYGQHYIPRLIRLTSDIEEWQQLAKIISLEPKLSTNKQSQIIRDFIIYQPISGFSVVRYRGENLKNKSRNMQFVQFKVMVHGLSIDDFMANKSLYGRYKRQDVERAFDLLLKEHLITALMKYNGKTRYVITDNSLAELIKQLDMFWHLELHLLELKWCFYERPVDRDQERIRLILGEMPLRRIVQKAEIVRSEFTKLKNIRPGIYTSIKNDLDAYFNMLSYVVNEVINNLKKKHSSTLQKYEFLNDVISMICPAVLQ
jgi:hypothetical protein